MLGVYVKKLGMLSVFDDIGRAIPVTVLQLVDNVVIRTGNNNGRDYAVVGIDKLSEKETTKLNKPKKSEFDKFGQGAFRMKKEQCLEGTDLQVGSKIDFSFLDGAKKVDVVGKTIGKGFAGVMKRHGFGGLPASHGVSITHRSHGSTGQRQDPGKVFKGKKMAGRMGADRVTTRNLAIFKIEDDIIFVKGSVPGHPDSFLFLRKAS